MGRWVLVSALFALMALMAGSAFGVEPADYVRENEPDGREFQVMEIEHLTVFFHQRMIGHATVMNDYIVYQFVTETDELLARKMHWRDDLPDRLPPLLINIAQAEAMVEGEVQSAKLYYIEPDSPVFPLDPTPMNPCWVVRSIVDDRQTITVIDAVEGWILGNGIPPPFTAFSLTGPTDHDPCSGDWGPWYENARDWFNFMGYSTEAVLWPTESKVQSHVSSNTTAMFYELAHGGSGGFASGCVGGTSYETTVPSEIETWIADYPAIPFTFIGSCGGMCSTADNTLSFEFRKGSTVETVTVGYCHMDQPECDDCWPVSLSWQNSLFAYMSTGMPVFAAFVFALADHPICIPGQCMRFAGDVSLAVVPVLPRRLNEPPVALCKDVTVPANASCVASASIDNGSYDPDGDPIMIMQDPQGPYPLGVTTVTLTVSDDHGWVVECTGDVTVVDVTDPAITCPGDATVEATEACGTPAGDAQLAAFFAGASATDNCDASVDISDDSPACFPLGTTHVMFTATDDATNTSSCVADVVVEDTTPPEIFCPDDITVECNGPGGTFADDPQLEDFFNAVYAIDIVDPNPVITNDAPDLFPLGTTTVEFTATDFSNNSSTCEAEVTVVDRGIDIWMEDVIANPGETVTIPVHIQDVTGWGLMGFEMEVCWCETPAGLLQNPDCIPGEVMINSGWTNFFCNPCDPTCITIVGAGLTPLEGEGILFYLEFHVSTMAKPCMCCDVWFEYIDIYDPENPLHVCWQNGSVCVEWCDVAGCIDYWKCCPDGCGGYYRIQPLEGVQVRLWESCSSSYLASTFTGADGCYIFPCLAPLDASCYFAVEAEYCRIPDCINPYDAAMILRYVTCQENLDDCPFTHLSTVVYPQQVAADVTCSSGITSYDASVLLQYYVGLIPAFPCYDPWVFYPLSPTGNLVYQCPGLVNWIGVLIGDVSGCIECPPPPAPLGGTVQVALGIPVDLGDRIEVPVFAQGAYDILSCNFDLVYDATELSVISAVPAGIAEASMSAYNAAGGDMVFGMATDNPYGGDGEIVLITFGKMNPDANVSSVALTDVMFNDGQPPAEIGASAGIPTESSQTWLGRAVPNPFTQGTVISYQMATPGRVSLEIYNVEGQLVKTLVKSSVDAGQHTVLWNGLDNSGQSAARGVYFCCMEAEGYRATEKIVFMK